MAAILHFGEVNGRIIYIFADKKTHVYLTATN